MPGTLHISHRLWRALTPLADGYQQWRRLCRDQRLDLVVAATYGGPTAAVALQAAACEGVATAVITNSWKDVYTHPFLPVTPDLIGVTTQREAEHLLRTSPHIAASRVRVTGSLHFERFRSPVDTLSREEFCQRHALSTGRPFVCYTAAAPCTVCEEEAIVEILLDALQRHPLRPQLLLRVNPREDGERFRHLPQAYPDLRIQRPKWEWDSQRDWNAPFRDDLDEWVATVQHAAFNVSIPSTVTWEFSALGRPTLNVCFDRDESLPYGKSNRRYWDAPYYREIRESACVHPAFSEQEFRARIETLLALPCDGIEPSLAGGSTSSVETVAQLLIGLLHSRKRWQRIRGRQS